MASLTVLSRLSSWLRQVALKLHSKSSVSAYAPLIKSSSRLLASPPAAQHLSRSSRLESMMPLHSGMASARLRSSLSVESKLGIDSSRHFNAFMTACLQQFFSGLGT